jgi:cytochrome P450
VSETFAKLAELRLEGGVCPAGPGVHLVVRHVEAAAVLRDYRTFSSDIALTPATQPFLHELDPPHHARVRSLLLFTGVAREAADSARPRIERVWSELAAQLGSVDRADLMREFARPGVRASFGEVVGIPESDRERVYALVADMRDTDSSSPPWGGCARPTESEASFAAYVVEKASARRRDDHPPDDLFTRLLFVTDSLGSTLSESELTMLMRLLCQAGIGSTSRALGNLLYELIRIPERYRRVRDDRGLAAAAIEESLRHDPPGLMVQRICTKDTFFDGVAMKPGDMVVVNLGSANRDEALYAAPDAFDPRRPRLAEHLAFGRGRHRCIGARLARAVLQTALLSLMDRVPEPPRLREGFTYKPETYGAWGPRSLDVELAAP